MTPDPIGLAGGINLYAYVGGNPINFTDPFGLWENPVEFWKDYAGGTKDFVDNYQDMRDANTIGADKYFHCKANCEALKRGLGGRTAAEWNSETREFFDEKLKGDSKSACDDDRAANKQGRDFDPNKSCQEQCNSLRPSNLDPRY